jgi:biotin transport system substrate-specific component
VVTAAAAQASLPVPPGPVPVTLQSLAVLLAGGILGARPAALAVLLYMAAGAAGLPVLAGGEGGWARVSGATGGYLIGFLPASWLCGRLAERASDRSYRTALLSLLAGHGVIFLFGVTWLSRFTGGWSAVQTGLVPFLPGTALKCLAGAAVLALWRRRPVY